MSLESSQDVDTGRSGLVATVTQAAKAFARHDMATYAAALSFHFLLSLFPFVIFVLALLRYLHVGAVFEWIRSLAQFVLPDMALQQLDQILGDIEIPRTGLLSTGGILALWLASRATRALMKALNVAYGAAESRPAWKRFPLSLAYTLALAAMAVFSTILMTVGPAAMQGLAGQFGLHSGYVVAWTWLRWPTLLALLVVGVAAVYHAGPNVHHRFRIVSAGSVLSVVAWVGGSIGFSYYVERFSSYSTMFGSIGAVIVLLLYLYLAAAVFLFGAELNAIFERQP